MKKRVHSTGGRSVLIIVENLPVPFDRRVWQEACALRDAGCVVTVICPSGKGYESSEEVIDDVRILRHRLPVEGNGFAGFVIEYVWAFFAELRLAWRVHRDTGFDAIHACNPPDNIFVIAAVFKLIAGTRFVFDHHDLCPELYEAKGGSRFSPMYLIVRLMERLTFALADVSIATNESYKAIALARGRMPEHRVFVVRSGPDLNRLRLVEPDPTLRRGRRYLVGYVGVMGKQEGIHHLVDAVAHLVHHVGRQDIQFCLVGGGPELTPMIQYAEERGVAEFVTFTGRVPDEEMLRVLSTSDVCVNPDTWNEMNDKSTMNKIMEYMALGKPIVQFDLTEGRVTAGEASVYARPNDHRDLASQIVRLLEAPATGQRMGQIGVARVAAGLRWSQQVPELLRAYDTVMTLSPPADRVPAGA